MGISVGKEGYTYNYTTILNFPYGVATGTPAISATYADGGFNWKRIDFTASSTLVVTQEGIFDLLMVSGGGGGGDSTGYSEGGGGGAGSQFFNETIFIPAGTYTVTIGAGGANNVYSSQTWGTSSGIATLRIDTMAGVGGGAAWDNPPRGYNGAGASYRGGYGGKTGSTAIGLFGFNGGSSDGGGNNGGGGGAGGAGGTRTAGVGVTSTFTGTSLVFGAGGLGGGTSGASGGAGTANRGNGGGGAIGNAAGQTGGSGVVIVRWKV